MLFCFLVDDARCSLFILSYSRPPFDLFCPLSRSLLLASSSLFTFFFLLFSLGFSLQDVMKGRPSLSVTSIDARTHILVGCGSIKDSSSEKINFQFLLLFAILSERKRDHLYIYIHRALIIRSQNLVCYLTLLPRIYSNTEAHSFDLLVHCLFFPGCDLAEIEVGFPPRNDSIVISSLWAP